MAIETLRATPCLPVDCVSARDSFRDAWTFGCAREATALPMQETLLHMSVNAYPYAGIEPSDSYSAAYPPPRFLGSRDREMQLRLAAFRTFHGGPRQKISNRLERDSGCEDFWSDASLSLPGFATPNEQNDAMQSLKASAGLEANISISPLSSTKESARQRYSFDDRSDDVLSDTYDEAASLSSCDVDEEQREDKRGAINMRYDSFPPPIASPTHCNYAYSHLPSCMQRVHFRSIKKDGRFILQELPTSAPQRYLRAERENGRLRLQLIDVEPFEAQAGPDEENDVEQYEAEEEEAAQEEELEGYENEDEAEVGQEDNPYAFSPTSELESDCYSEDSNGDDAKGNSIHRLTSLNSDPVGSWRTSRDFLHESLNRIRPLVY